MSLLDNKTSPPLTSWSDVEEVTVVLPSGEVIIVTTVVVHPFVIQQQIQVNV